MKGGRGGGRKGKEKDRGREKGKGEGQRERERERIVTPLTHLHVLNLTPLPVVSLHLMLFELRPCPDICIIVALQEKSP